LNIENTPAVYAKIENRPGSLERLARLLGDARINIDAIGAETLGSTGLVRLSTSKAREAVEVLRSANIEAYVSDLVQANPQNKPGELAKLCAELAAAGLNVESIVTTPEGRLAFHTNDAQLATSILRKL
jgi:hypothetical protein